MNEAKNNSEPLNVDTSTTFVLSLEKKCRPVVKNGVQADCPRIVQVRFPFVDWDEEIQRGARGFAQRKARKNWGKRMTPEDRTRLITRTFQWLQDENNRLTTLELYSSNETFKINLDHLLRAGEQKPWILKVMESMQVLFSACGGHPPILQKLDAFRKKQGGELSETEKNDLIVLDNALLAAGVTLDSPTDSSASHSYSTSQPSTDEIDAGDEQD
jgi:hypothetical protein